MSKLKVPNTYVIIFAVLLTGVITAAFSMAGIRIGNIFGSRFRKPSEITGGLILMLMGINILLQHMLG